MDMDLDELFDGPKQEQPSRSSRFTPKGSKFQPKPKPKPKAEPESSSLLAPKKEEVDVKPEVKPEHDNSAVAMDVELNLSEKKVEVTGDFMETEAADVGFGFENGDGDGDGDEDEVVREIDVYFSPSVDPETQLYLFQYPLRPLWRPYELDERCEEVRVKPTSAEVEVDLAIDVDSRNYDASADPKLKMDKQTLAQSWKPPKANGCTVGVLTGNKLHLSPIHAVVQLRPSMRHLDQKESKRRIGVGNHVEDVMKLEEQQEGKPSGLSKKQKAPEPTKDIEEGWVPLKYHSASSDMAAGYLEKLVAREGSEISFSMSPDDYLNSLCPGTSGDSLSSKGPPRRSLLAKPLNERFKTWLLEGPPLHRFDTLKYLAPDDSIEKVLTVLQDLAMFVQGLWVPKTTVCGAAGPNALARDYVLLLFSKDVIIKEEQLPKSLSPVLVKAMKDVLHGFATYRSKLKDWKLKELPDLNFIRLYPDVVKKQQELWDIREKNIEGSVSVGRNRPGMKTSKSSAPTHLLEPKGSSKISVGPSSGSTSKNGFTDEDREAIKKALQKLFKSTKTCSDQQIIPRLRAMALSEKARSKGSGTESVDAVDKIDANPNERQAIISEVAVNVHGIWVPKSSPDNRDFDALRKVVIDLFLAEGPNARLRKAHIVEAANLQLKGQVMADAAYKKVLQEICVSQGSGWVLRNDDSNLKH